LTRKKKRAEVSRVRAATIGDGGNRNRRQGVYWYWLLGGVVGLVALGLWLGARRGTQSERQALTPHAAAAYVTSAACKECHAVQFAAWDRSQHAAAMAEASERTVLGDFANARFTSGGITSTFIRRDGQYLVETDGPDGRPAQFAIKYTFGIAPLQQYLIELPRGRLQALSIAWDTRAKAEGGQRWFHLYSGQRIGSDDPLHWTGLQQNWNFMCADCHSTRLRKNFNAATNEFHTTWSEISVGCEACHGPGSKHVDWARNRGTGQPVPVAAAGLEVAFSERKGIVWAMDPSTGIAVRSRPRDSAREITTCAQCHSRRAQISEDYSPGRPLGDGYLAALLDDGLYWPDGQMRDEVYNFGSFLQSRMYAKGVTCGDCHDPHSGQLRARGNAVCAQCHAPAKFDGAAHHHHATGSPGAQCAACHLPTTTYMGVDARHDHSMRVPRPQQSIDLGVPNACNRCHADHTPQWAEQALEHWNGHAPHGYQTYAEAFAGAVRSGTGARGALLAIAGDPGQPAIVRASALSQLASDGGGRVLDAAAAATHDPDELVRRAAVAALANSAPQIRLRQLAPLTDDPVRAVRIDAARALAAAPESAIPEQRRAAVRRGLDEYLASQTYNADRPESYLNLGAFYAERGELREAEAAYRKALALVPQAAQPVIGLADIYRRRGDIPAGEALLLECLKRHPRSAELELALGLAYVGQGNQEQALLSLRAAAAHAPSDANYSYVYGVALNSYGQPALAIRTLDAAHRRFPGDRPMLKALASIERDRGHREAALNYAQALVALAADDPESQALLLSLR
jgi:predicted CXXCH cytochrome family protein